VVFPSPGTGLPSPVQTNVSGMPAGAQPHGVSYAGNDTALVADFNSYRVLVVKISTATVVDTIATGTSYSGAGTIAVAPGFGYALAAAYPFPNRILIVIAAPFVAGASVAEVELPGAVNPSQTQAIVFNAGGRAFVHCTNRIAVLDPPYTSVGFTIPMTSDLGGGIAITPDGKNLLVTNTEDATVTIFKAPFSAQSVPEPLTIPGAGQLDGIAASPDGTKVLVVSSSVADGLYAISPPYNSGSVVEHLPIGTAFGTHEDIGISPDGKLAILAGNGASNPNTAFIKAPFTAAGATVYTVTVPGGRGNGAVRFPPAGPLPGLTLTKVARTAIHPGDSLTYTLKYGNVGTADAQNVVIRDPVPSGSSFVSATNGGTNVAGVVTWNLGTVPAGLTDQSVSFTVNPTVIDGSIENAGYTIEATGTGPLAGPAVTTVVGTGPRSTFFYTLTPCRAVDTRRPDGALGGPALVADAPRSFTLAGTCGIPADASAVVLNATVTEATAGGHLQLFAAGASAPETSVLSFPASVTRASNAIVSLSEGGAVTAISKTSSGTAHLIVDVSGYFQ